MNYPFILPMLPYPYYSLEPFIDEDTLYYHHDKHFKGYIDKLNAVLSKYPELHDKSLEWLLINENQLPPVDKETIMKNAGGVYNHLNYFNNLTETKDNLPKGKVLDLIIKKYESFEKFKEIFSLEAENVFGSGYVHLVIDEHHNLSIVKTANQEAPISHGQHPLVTMDVWEHAYYLKYKNLRKNYIKNFWNIVKFPSLSNE